MSNRARDQRAFCIKRPDGALLITTMERSNSRCWQQFVYHSGTPVSRREYESHGYQCVKTSIAEYATESPKPEQAYIPPPEPEYLIQGAIILTDEHTIVKLPKSVRMNDCYIMNRKDYSNDRYIPQDEGVARPYCDCDAWGKANNATTDCAICTVAQITIPQSVIKQVVEALHKAEIVCFNRHQDTTDSIRAALESLKPYVNGDLSKAEGADS